MDYQTQQLKLLPLIATAYALKTSGMNMLKMFVQVQSEMRNGKFDSLPEVTVYPLFSIPLIFLSIFFIIASCN